MASSRIKGITIVLGADVTELNKALKGIDDTLSTTQNKLKDIDKLLKFDPTNANLLKQKQGALNTEIKTTEERLKVLKQAFNQNQNPRYVEKLKSKLAEIKPKCDEAEKAYESLKKELEKSPKDVDLKKQAQEAKEEFGKLKLEVEKTQAQLDSTRPDALDNLQREIIETEQKLKKATKAAKEFGTVFAQQLQATGDKLINAGKKIQSVANEIGKVGAAMTVAVTMPVAKFSKEAVQQASDYEENLNKLNVIYGQNIDSIIEWSKASTKAYGLSQNEALDMIALYGDLATSMGFSEQEAETMATALAARAGDIASFKNKDVEEVENALKSIFSGTVMPLTNLGFPSTIGNLMEYTEAEQEEMIQRELEAFGESSSGFGKKWKDMTQREKVMTRYLYVMDKSAKAEGDYQRTAEGTANTIKTFNAEIENLKTTIGEKLLPVITPIIQDLTEIVRKISEMDPDKLEKIIKIALGAAAIGPILSIVAAGLSVVATLVKGVGGAIKGVGKAIKFFKTGSGASIISFLTSTPGLIMIAVAAVTAAVVAIVKNWDTVKELFETAKELLARAKKRFEDWVLNIGTTIGDFFLNIYRKIGEWLKWYWTAFTSFWGSVWTGITTWLSNVGTTISNKWTEIKTNTSKKVQEIIDAIVGFFTGLPDRIRTAMDSVKTAAQEKWNSIKNWFSNNPIVASISSTASNLWGKAKSALGWYAKAMDTPYTFNRPTVIGVGEAGSETVIGTRKLNQLLARAGSTNNSVVVNVNANVANNVDINRLADTISNRIQQQVNMRVAAAR